MAEEITLKKKNVWTGAYRNIPFEINNFKIDGYDYIKESWTFYLFFCAEQFPVEFREKVIPKTHYTAFGTPLTIPDEENPIVNFEWHGGLTYIRVCDTEPFTRIKAGCDYQHLWDEGRYYDEQSLKCDVVTCIDSVYDRFPNLINTKELMDEFRKKFPGKDSSFRQFDRDGNNLEPQGSPERSE